MAIVGFNFEYQPIASADMAAIFRGLFSDGPLHGCGITYSGRNLTIAPGRMMIGGFGFRLTTNQVLNVSGTSGQASIVCKIDLSQPSTEISFGQVAFRVEAGDYAPTQEDLDAGTGNVYEVVLCKVSLDSSGITGITDTIKSAHRTIFASTREPASTDGKDGDLWFIYEG